MAVGVHVAFIIVSTVLLLNLLIAILSKTFTSTDQSGLPPSQLVGADNQCAATPDDVAEQERIGGGMNMQQRCSGSAHLPSDFSVDASLCRQHLSAIPPIGILCRVVSLACDSVLSMLLP